MTKSTGMKREAVWAAIICGTSAFAMMAASAFAQAPTDAAPRVDVNYPHPPPPYPDSAQINSEEGTVVLKVRVLADGRVRKVEIDQSSGFDDLDNAAVEGVLRWHFLPAVRDGDTTSEWTTVEIVYQLPRPVLPPAPPAKRS